MWLLLTTKHTWTHIFTPHKHAGCSTDQMYSQTCIIHTHGRKPMSHYKHIHIHTRTNTWESSAKPHIHTGLLARHKPHSYTRTLLRCIPPRYWSRPRHRMPVHLAPWATGRRSRRRNRWVPAVWMRAPGTQLLYCNPHTHTHTCMHEDKLIQV